MDSQESKNVLFETETFTDGKALGSRINGCTFRFCEFEKMKPEWLEISGEFVSCFFKNVDLYWGLFNQTLFVDTRFEKCIFRGSTFAGCRFLNCEFVDCQFVKDNLNADCTFDNTRWFECKAMGCTGLPDVSSSASMENEAARAYIQKLISEFKIPGSDWMSRCLLIAPGKAQSGFGAGVFITHKKAEGFYSDIYEFWVRACFSFSEKVQRYHLLQEIQPFVHCVEGSDSERWSEYIDAIRKLAPDDYFLECQSFPESRIELERSLSDVTLVVDCPFLRSFVGKSNGKYLAFFKLPDMFQSSGQR